MFIRILTSRENLPVSTELEVEDEKARGWVAAGDAEPATPPAPVPPVDADDDQDDSDTDASPVETAVDDAPVEKRTRRRR